MAFPEDRMPIRVRAAFGADADASPSTWSWTDITADVHAQQVTITRGQPNEGSEPTPTSISLVLDNPHGDYTPDNALGANYPNVDQGVPLEYSVEAGLSYLTLGGAGRAVTPDAPALDITGDIDIRLDATLDAWQGVSNLMELAGKYVSTGEQRSWLLMLWTDRRIALRWTTDGTIATVQQHLSTAPVQPLLSGRLAIRVTVDVDNGAGGFTVRYYTAPTLAGPWTQLGDPVTVIGVTSLFGGTAPVEIGNVPALGFETATGRVHGFELRDGINATVVANPDFTTVAPGTSAFIDGSGRSWSVTDGSAVEAWKERFLGHVDSWEPVWPYGDLSHADDGEIDYEGESQVTVTASGILRRMGQGEEPLQSTLTRRIPSFDPVAYWTCEDGRGATQAYSPLSAVRPLALSGFDMAANDTLAGSAALCSIQGGAFLSGTVPAPAADTDQWHTEFVFLSEAGPATLRTVLQWRGTGTVKRWRLMLDAGGAQIRGYDADDTQILLEAAVLTGLGVFGAWTRWKLFATQNGSNVDYTIAWVPIGGTGGFIDGSYAGSVGRISGVMGPEGGYSSDLNGLALGHLGVFTDADTLAYNNADTGFDGESAGARMTRLCQEEGIPFTLSGSAADTEPMGPQRPATLTSLLAEGAAVDGGILGEQRAAFGLLYRTRVSLYNQTPALVLDAGNNEIVNPFAPVLDDQRLRNAITVSREGGSSAVAIDQASITRRRRYASSVPVNAHSDDQLAALAHWRLHLGTWPGMRYPSVSSELAIAPQLIDAWLGLDYGDRLQAVNLPPQHPYDTVDLLLQGYSETISPTRWTVQSNCMPAGPYDVAVVGPAGTASAPGQFRWIDTSGSQLVAALTATDTTVRVLTTSGPRWTPNVRDTPFDWRVSGEVMTVTAPGALVNTNAFFDTDASGWTAQSCTIARSTAVVCPHPRAIASLLITPNGSSAVGGALCGQSAAGSITPGAAYTASMWVYSPGGWSDLRPAVNWHDAAGTFLSSSFGSTGFAVTAGQWTYLEQTFTAPASASRAVVRAHHAGTPAASDIYYVWAVRITQTKSSWLHDSYGRTAASGWGTADSSQAWTVTGTAADYSVNASYGIAAQPSTGVAHLTTIASPSADVDLYVDVAASALATGASLFTGAIVRAVDNSNLYQARVDFNTSNQIVLTLRKRVAGVETQLGSTYTSPLTHVAGTFYRMRVQVFGTALKAKIWPTTAAEPGPWHIETTDTALTAAASVGTRSFRNTGNTNAGAELRFDNFEVINPQTYTVTRSTNGVSKAQAAAAKVSLAHPAYVAL